MKKFKIVIVVSMLYILMSNTLLATTVLFVNLEEMVREADRIFVGTCISEISEKDENGLSVTTITFSISEKIKGNLGDTITIKQFGIAEPLSDDMVMHVPGMPKYTKGEDVLLFLRTNSRYGFTSPIGLFQGKFTIKKDKGGDKVVLNGINNVGLLETIKDKEKYMTREPNKKIFTQKKGPIKYDHFISLVKEMTTGR